MFFIKNDRAEIPVEELEIYSRCPLCGKVDEITEEFWELVTDPESNFDIYGSNMYCVNCSEKSNRIRAVLTNHMPKSELDSVMFRVMEAVGSSAD